MVGAVRLVLDEGKTVGAVARELDLTPSALGNWVRQARADRSQGKTGLTTEERTELARLRKENRELRMERDILKKAAAGSTGQCNSGRSVGLDPVSWTSSERWIRWPEWDQSRQGDERDDSSLRSSWSARSGWCWMRGRRSGPWPASSI